MNRGPQSQGKWLVAFVLSLQISAAAAPAIAPVSDFSFPMYFETRDGSVIIKPPEVDYELSADNSLRIGNVLINEKSLLFTNRQLGQVLPQLKSLVSTEELNESYFFVKWPLSLIATGKIEMISREGKVLWKFDVDESTLKSWKLLRETWKNKLRDRKGKPAVPQSTLFQVTLGLKMSAVQLPIENQQSYRFCISSQKDRASTRICSRRYSSRKNGGYTQIAKIVSDAAARVLLQSAVAPLKGSAVASMDAPTSFYADLATGESYEFIAFPTAPKLMDISLNETAGTYQIVGTDTHPNQDVVLLNSDRESKFAKAMGFESTIKDTRIFWATQTPRERAELYFPGQGAGLFLQKLVFNDIPSNRLRPFLDRRTLPGTYVDGAYIRGQRVPEIQVTTEQNSISFDSKDPSLFAWRFGAPIKGQVNRSYLSVTSDKQSARAYYELYRGYGNELSGRFSGILSAGQGLVMGEVAFNHWFENVFGWENYLFAKQRWGASYKYFKSLTQIAVDDQGGKATLSSTNFDLKYRFTPGLWTREETMGLMLDYQRITFDPLHSTMLGVGWLWARSMPRLFDKIFSYLPYMDYPKWVDMELIYYVASMDSNVQLNTNFALNFHGQVLWKNWFFGEAGFGMKRYAFTDTFLNQKAELNTFYGTVGLGLKF